MRPHGPVEQARGNGPGPWPIDGTPIERADWLKAAVDRFGPGVAAVELADYLTDRGVASTVEHHGATDWLVVADLALDPAGRRLWSRGRLPRAG